MSTDPQDNESRLVTTGQCAHRGKVVAKEFLQRSPRNYRISNPTTEILGRIEHSIRHLAKGLYEP